MDILIKPKKKPLYYLCDYNCNFFYGGDEYFFNEYECG